MRASSWYIVLSRINGNLNVKSAIRVRSYGTNLVAIVFSVREAALKVIIRLSALKFASK